MRYTFEAPGRDVNKVFLHCSDSDRPEHDDVSVIRGWHLLRGFGDVGYHLFIRGDGTVQPGRDLEVVPAAQQYHNSRTIAVCLHGRTGFTRAQFDSLRDVCLQIHRQLPLVTFHGHREVNRGKTCPNFDYRAELGLDDKGRLT